jgi:hypothetical protein
MLVYKNVGLQKLLEKKLLYGDKYDNGVVFANGQIACVELKLPA